MNIAKKVTIGVVVIAALSIGALLLIDRHRAIAETENTCVPNKTCKSCHHGKQFKQQAETYHARAFEDLESDKEKSDPKCLLCHTTGYGKPGGFVDTKSTPDLAGVTCQACHGPGSAHVKKGLKEEERRQAIKGNPAEACIKCHEIHKETDMLHSLKRKVEKLQKRSKELES